MKRFPLFCVFTFALLLVVLDACSPAPRRNLSSEDKTADFYWLFSQFNENYAPLEYKQGRYGFDYEQLKARYLAEAQRTASNDEFYKLEYSFVSEFKDAHTSASMTASQLPARTKVAYLGFSGKRVGDALVVTELLPTIKADATHFPIRLGDKITKLGGVALKDVVANEMVKWRNLGQDEANLTYHMNKIFNRVSISNGLPSGDTAVLTVIRDKKLHEISLPWIVKDLYAFQREQKDAAKTAPAKKAAEEQAIQPALFQLGFLRWDGKMEDIATVAQKIVRGLPTYNFWETFRFVDNTPAWASRLVPELGAEGEAPASDLLAKNRKVPDNAIPIADAKTYPTYVTREKLVGADGKETGATKFVAYMYLNTFSPSTPEDQVVKELQATLGRLKELGVNDLVVDMIDNGGGSLVLGMKIAQLLSKEKVVQPDIQFRLSETWLDEFEKASLVNDSDAEREMSRRVFEALTADKAAGRRLSRRFSVETLQPFAFVPNEKLESKLNIVLLVNEMCASMCDIFTATMKDNGLARVVGSRTMGAGGNVVDHYEAPNSHISVRQTESLMVRVERPQTGRTPTTDGTYIENNGVEPDVAVAVNESVIEKYAPVIKKGYELLLTEKKQ